ncbi:hypothetical protein [Alkalicoccobacillus porphyridii]|uniref:YtxH domain-containing protein n=1 Tax=Alkalicoccobacillus porphyridii TaxID=2597270 RepID=A0A553ZXI2_9BACI|nr:hypothetical protein [Alkalicoccobacillus porphyridii]TSB46160.1 hypothetical protein FN960_12410 [Alkalicoccobacillus porphyridii]
MGLKKWLVFSAVAGAVSGTAIWLNDESRRARVSKVIRNSYQKVSNKVTPGGEKSTEELGNPIPESADSKMVGEGALYSVQRYNEKQQLNHK